MVAVAEAEALQIIAHLVGNAGADHQILERGTDLEMNVGHVWAIGPSTHALLIDLFDKSDDIQRRFLTHASAIFRSLPFQSELNAP